MDKGTFLKKVGKNIVRIRKERNITQEKLANLLETHGYALRRIEKGEVNTTIWTLKKIAKALDVDIKELL